MNSDFEEVARFVNPLEARQAFLVLSHNGMHAFIEGENTNSTLWYVGSAIGGVRLLVPNGEKKRAIELLGKNPAAEIGSKTAWRCGNCAAEVDAGFDVCWRCGNDRESNSNDLNKGIEFTSIASSDALADTNEGKTQDETNAHSEIEATIARAWRAAVLGMIGLPFFATAYSVYLLLGVLIKAPKLTPRFQRMMMAALAIDLLAAMVLGLLIRVFAS